MVPDKKIAAAQHWIDIMYPGITDPIKIEKLKKEYFAMTKNVAVRPKKYPKKKKIVVRYKYKITTRNFLTLIKAERNHIFKKLRDFGVKLSYVQLRYLILITYEQLYDYPLKVSLKRMGINRIKTQTLEAQGLLKDGELTDLGKIIYNECINVVVTRSGFEVKESSFRYWIFEQ